MMENKRHPAYFLPFFRPAFCALFLLAALSRAAAVPGSVAGASGGEFSVTRGGTGYVFHASAATQLPLELQEGDIVKTGSGTSLRIRDASGADVFLEENTAFFLRPEDYPSGNADGAALPAAGELFYGRMRVVSPAGQPGPKILVSSLTVVPEPEADFACDMLYTASSGGEAAVSCFSGSAAVYRQTGEPAPVSGGGVPSPVTLHAREMLRDSPDTGASAAVPLAVEPVPDAVLAFWDIPRPEPAENLPAAEPSVPMQERILPETVQPSPSRPFFTKDSLRTGGALLFFGGFLLSGATMYVMLNETAPGAVKPLGVSSALLLSSGLITLLLSGFAD